MADKVTDEEVIDVCKKYHDLFIDMMYDKIYSSLVDIDRDIEMRYKYATMGDDIKDLYDRIHPMIGLGQVPKKKIREFVLSIEPMSFIRTMTRQCYISLSLLGLFMGQWISLYDMIVEEDEMKEE